MKVSKMQFFVYKGLENAIFIGVSTLPFLYRGSRKGYFCIGGVRHEGSFMSYTYFLGILCLILIFLAFLCLILIFSEFLCLIYLFFGSFMSYTYFLDIFMYCTYFWDIFMYCTYFWEFLCLILIGLYLFLFGFYVVMLYI